MVFCASLYVAAEGGIGIEETDSGQGNTKVLLSPTLGWANSIGISVYVTIITQGKPTLTVLLHYA